MHIWVDADACPRPVKEILFRASERTGIAVVLVANSALPVPRTGNVRAVQVGRGFDVADEYIAEQVEKGDLVITADVPLAAQAVEKGATCIDFRGDIIDADNARFRLAIRDFMEERRADGELSGGPKAFGDRDKRKFAGALDRWLARRR